jgi:hypothetical protein
MQISPEGKIGIALTLLFGAGGGAAMSFPDQRWIGTLLMIIALVGMVLLGFHHFEIERKKMGPIIFMGVGVLLFASGLIWWTFLPTVPASNSTKDSPAETAKEANGAPHLTAPKPTLSLPQSRPLSTMGKKLYRCPVAVPAMTDNEAREKQIAEMRKRFQILGDAIGVSVPVTETSDGIKIEFEAKTPEGQIRLGLIHKVTIEFKRVGNEFFVTVSTPFPEPLGLLFDLMPAPTDKDQNANWSDLVEQLLGVEKGACQLL